METTFTKPRRPWLAALLSLLGGPLGQVYAGCLRRGVVLWIVGALLLPVLAFLSISLPLGRLGFASLVLCVLLFPFYLAVDAFLLARRASGAPLKWYQRWWVYVLVYVALIAASNGVAHAVRAFIAEAFLVPTGTMAPTIQAGDRIVVDKLWADSSRLQRNDVVVYRSEGPDSPLYLKRVAGLPGDRVEIKAERVLVNGAPWDDNHAVFEGPLPPYVELSNYGPVTIPADCFFVLGDNRRRSKDSRISGPIPLSDFCGKARLIYWSRPRQFPDPDDTTRYTLGPIRWDRIGARLD